MIMGGVYIVLGVLFVFFPGVLATFISFILGIVLILSGLAGLYFWNLTRNLR